ncbi:hypothetical protein GCM10027569_80520 [Flindersiella endophytica]
MLTAGHLSDLTFRNQPPATHCRAPAYDGRISGPIVTVGEDTDEYHNGTARPLLRNRRVRFPDRARGSRLRCPEYRNEQGGSCESHMTKRKFRCPFLQFAQLDD